MITMISKKLFFLLLFFITCVVGGIGVASYFGFIEIEIPLATLRVQQPIKITQEAIESDVAALSNVEQNFTGVRAFFVSLAQEKGGVYAFEVLKQAPVPPNTDLHLLGHAVGDELYKQQGLDGMQYCNHDFRNACSHSIVVGALLATGMDVFGKVNDVCKKAPGGPGAYTMCFHGLGHGVLAYVDYDVPQAVALCKKVGTEEYHNEEIDQCIGGMVMEMYGGINDPKAWEAKKDLFLSPTDPLKMCKAAYMPESAKVLCYSYITPFIFDAAGAQNGNPTPDIYPKAFSYCDEVTDTRQRNSCYGGLGKEFIVLSQDRDIRRIEDTPNDKLMLTASWCDLAPKNEAKIACLLTVVDSLYWGGENDPQVSVRYCSLLESGEPKSACFSHLFQITTYYQPDKQIRKTICDAVPSDFIKQCEQILF